MSVSRPYWKLSSHGDVRQFQQSESPTHISGNNDRRGPLMTEAIEFRYIVKEIISRHVVGASYHIGDVESQ